MSSTTTTTTPAQPNPPSLFLSLPTEILTAIFLFLATDSLVAISLTCHDARSVVAQLPSWAEHALRFDNRYTVAVQLENAVKHAIAVPQRVVREGGGEFAARVVSVALDQAQNMPIDIRLVLYMLDNFTSLREASFVGCLESGGDFIREASRDGRVAQWKSHGLQQLNLSDSRTGVMTKVKRPLAPGNTLDGVAWDCAADDLGSPAVVAFQRLFLTRSTSIPASPKICILCQISPVHSWSAAARCVFCIDPWLCLECGYADSGRSFDTRCPGRQRCRSRVKSCRPCRTRGGWTKCTVNYCNRENCPKCSGPCMVCGKICSFCAGHRSFCNCELVCPSCLDRVRCKSCGVSLSCARCGAWPLALEEDPEHLICPYCYSVLDPDAA